MQLKHYTIKHNRVAKTLTIGLVNPHAEEKTVTVNLPGVEPNGKAAMWQIGGNDPKAFNTVDRQPVTIEQRDDVDFDRSVKLSPCSATLIRLPAQQN